MAELYVLFNSAVGWRELPATMRPAGSSPAIPSNLVRARGSLIVHDLSDGLPAPAPVQLTGLWDAEDEESLLAVLDWWRWFLHGCTQYCRGQRPAEEVQGASLIWTPAGDESQFANVTITLIPRRMPDPAALPLGAKGV